MNARDNTPLRTLIAAHLDEAGECTALAIAKAVGKACEALMASGERLGSAARTKRLIALMLHDTLNDRRSVAREIGCAEAELTVSRDRIPRGFAEAVEHAYKTINE
jgi:hypothetical protein